MGLGIDWLVCVSAMPKYSAGNRAVLRPRARCWAEMGVRCSEFGKVSDCLFTRRAIWVFRAGLTISRPPDLACLRALVRHSWFDVGLVAMKSRVFLELSPSAAALTGLRSSDDPPVDLDVITADNGLVVSLRVVARDADQAYAIVLFSTSDVDEPAQGAGPRTGAAVPSIETLLGPFRDLGIAAGRSTAAPNVLTPPANSRASKTSRTASGRSSPGSSTAIG